MSLAATEDSTDAQTDVEVCANQTQQTSCFVVIKATWHNLRYQLLPTESAFSALLDGCVMQTFFRMR